MLTQDRLKELLHYDPETGIFTRLVKTGSRACVGRIAGRVRADGYITLGVCRSNYLAHRLAWLYVYGEFPDCEIDHFDQNPSNNRLWNLRLATNKQNAENSRLSGNNTSGFKGVSWVKRSSNWRASICHNGKQINLGHFSTIEEAVAARKEMEDKLFTHHKKSIKEKHND